MPLEDAAYTYVGTTDTAYDGPLDEPLCTPEDVDYLLERGQRVDVVEPHAERRHRRVGRDCVRCSRRRGRAVTERTADLSRRHRVTDSRDGVVHVTGGKWTTYRLMAEHTVDALGPYVTHLQGRAHEEAPRSTASEPWRPTIGPARPHLYERFGEDAPVVVDSSRTTLARRVPIEGLPYVGAEFVFAARDEIAMSLIDLLTRRTRAHLHDARATFAARRRVARSSPPSSAGTRIARATGRRVRDRWCDASSAPPV